MLRTWAICFMTSVCFTSFWGCQSLPDAPAARSLSDSDNKVYDRILEIRGELVSQYAGVHYCADSQLGNLSCRKRLVDLCQSLDKIAREQDFMPRDFEKAMAEPQLEIRGDDAMFLRKRFQTLITALVAKVDLMLQAINHHQGQKWDASESSDESSMTAE
ncbi:hypothetical protein [Pseudobacteriovorax antillogorgiicola]|uniref:Uncharacterized protein n=1 Tax=Pseudobacteriovorax antillogorgiicola TaxID=1513793 RepID=A0A1Y6CLH1_9BACT|nr:hypothetical protein [Pseudobacteriovorax antillogorgiicola]TCS47566.1 hypothetical protein EDD56_1207 [Pseudobacteriovorax antillogorgiicola]SMF60503.1 hypothetical protein SAMN06296036_120133 [Pseudobacteriovorax antillogorgiicola]